MKEKNTKSDDRPPTEGTITGLSGSVSAKMQTAISRALSEHGDTLIARLCEALGGFEIIACSSPYALEEMPLVDEDVETLLCRMRLEQQRARNRRERKRALRRCVAWLRHLLARAKETAEERRQASRAALRTMQREPQVTNPWSQDQAQRIAADEQFFFSSARHFDVGKHASHAMGLRAAI